ncbi:MAG: cupredoxin domain-containing protein [Nitrososphaeraceae archaeon]
MKHKRTFVIAGNGLAFILLSLPFLSVGSETLAQGTNTTITNTTNATAASAGEVSPITVVMPAGSAAAVGGGGYEPNPATVSPSNTIVWVNQDNALHTATSGNPETAVLDGLFDTGYVMANQQSNPVPMPTEPGKYTYFCTLHPFLTSAVIVQ